MAVAALPPWLNIAPEQFTQAAIAGAQLGSRTATDAAEIAQRGILGAEEIANKAEQLQVQRENIAADLAARQAAASQRANEAAAEIALKQQAFDLEKAAQAEAGARIAQKDALWQEGLSRYQRAVNAGDDPAAADLEIIQPLRDVGVAPGGKTARGATAEPWSIFNTGGGELVRANRRTGESEVINQATSKSTKSNKPEAAPKMDALTVSKRKLLENEIMSKQKVYDKSILPEEKGNLARVIRGLKTQLEELLAPAQVTTEFAPPDNFNAIMRPMQMIPPMERRAAPGTMIPPMPGTTNAPAGLKILSIRKR